MTPQHPGQRLHGPGAKFTPAMFPGPGDLHFASPGIDKLADRMADRFSAAVEKKHDQAGPNPS